MADQQDFGSDAIQALVADGEKNYAAWHDRIDTIAKQYGFSAEDLGTAGREAALAGAKPGVIDKTRDVYGAAFDAAAQALGVTSSPKGN